MAEGSCDYDQLVKVMRTGGVWVIVLGNTCMSKAQVQLQTLVSIYMGHPVLPHATQWTGGVYRSFVVRKA